VRLAESDRQRLLVVPGAAPFEMRGRVMREYAVVPEAMTKDRRELRGWVDRAFAYAAALHAKARKQKPKR
jgi:TfoX/Sxy family transcriptional regulator of competence genes